MRNSTILFLASFVILVWFGSETFSGQELCAMSCISLSGLNMIEDGIVVAILPVLLLIGGIKARSDEKHRAPTTTQAPSNEKA